MFPTLDFLNDSFDQLTKLQAILIMLKTLIFYGLRNRLSCLGTPDNEEGLSKRIQTRRPVSTKDHRVYSDSRDTIS